MQSPTGSGKTLGVVLGPLVSLNLAALHQLQLFQVIYIGVPLEEIRESSFLPLLDALVSHQPDLRVVHTVEDLQALRITLDRDGRPARLLIVVIPGPAAMIPCMQELRDGFIWQTCEETVVLDEVHLWRSWAYQTTTTKGKATCFRPEMKVLGLIPESFSHLVLSATVTPATAYFLQRTLHHPFSRFVLPSRRNDLRLITLPIREGEHHSYIQFFIDRYPNSKVFHCSSALLAAETCEYLNTQGREMWCVVSTNRGETGKQALTSTALSTDAVIATTQSMATGVNLPAFTVGIISRLHTIEDISQQVGRLARQDGLEGTAFILYTMTELASKADDPADRASLRSVLTSAKCVQQALEASFLVPAGHKPQTCLDMSSTLSCGICDGTLLQELLAAYATYRDSSSIPWAPDVQGDANHDIVDEFDGFADNDPASDNGSQVKQAARQTLLTRHRRQADDGHKRLAARFDLVKAALANM